MISLNDYPEYFIGRSRLAAQGRTLENGEAMAKVEDQASVMAKEILHSGKNLPPMPENGPELLTMAQKPIERIDVAKLTKLIKADPSMVAKILRLANSAYFGTLNRIYNLHQAVMHIGLNETINTVCFLFYKKALPEFPNLEGFTDNDYWSHSWACATANKMLGHPRLMTKPLPGELYIAGLLHGIGKLFLALHRPDDFLKCIHRSIELEKPLDQTEMEVLGTTDGYIASEVLQAWRLPANICMAVKHFYKPEEAEEEGREIAALTQFAYFIANSSGIGNVSDRFNVDLADTWICRDGSTVLSQAGTQETYVQQIYADVKNKSQLLTGMEEDENPDEEDNSTVEEITPKRQYQRKERPKGFFARLLAFFK